ncbi:MAG: TetR/AcrR family transcriptional regulator [Microbacterium sp.]
MTTRPPSASATPRNRAKNERHRALLREAARLFAARGFDGVSLEDLGTAVGITGPAVYRHFENKRALLGTLLLSAGEELLAGGRRAIDAGGDERGNLRALIDFHVDFAVAHADIVRVHDRDLPILADDDRRLVRRLQREYVELWVGVLQGVHPAQTDCELRIRAHAGLGLMNATPYTVRAQPEIGADAPVQSILSEMAYAAMAHA